MSSANGAAQAGKAVATFGTNSAGVCQASFTTSRFRSVCKVSAYQRRTRSAGSSLRNRGPAGIGSLVRAALPYVFAVAAQTVVVISGGVDLSVASMMALTSVTAARMMQGASDEFAILVVALVLLLGLMLGAINGALIVVTRVPDIVVTLAMLFVWQGAALLVLEGKATEGSTITVSTTPATDLEGEALSVDVSA